MSETNQTMTINQLREIQSLDNKVISDMYALASSISKDDDRLSSIPFFSLTQSFEEDLTTYNKTIRELKSHINPTTLGSTDVLSLMSHKLESMMNFEGKTYEQIKKEVLDIKRREESKFVFYRLIGENASDLVRPDDKFSKLYAAVLADSERLKEKFDRLAETGVEADKQSSLIELVELGGILNAHVIICKTYKSDKQDLLDKYKTLTDAIERYGGGTVLGISLKTPLIGVIEYKNEK